MALATDNGSQFSADTVTIWLGVVDCRHFLTALSHPCSSGQAKNSIRTLKTAINLISASTFDEIERVVITLLLQYRNASRNVTNFIKVIKRKGALSEHEVFRVFRSYMLSYK